MVPNPFNWSPNTVFSDISVTVALIKKFQKTKSIFFQILVQCGPPPTQSTGPQPIQLVPKHCFYRYLSIGRSKKFEFLFSILHICHISLCVRLFSTGVQVTNMMCFGNSADSMTNLLSLGKSVGVPAWLKIPGMNISGKCGN